MARVRHLRRAPITEAVVDFRIRPLLGAPVEQLRAAFHNIQGFPAVEEMRGMVASFGPFALGGKAQATGMPGKVKDLGVKGFLARSDDRKTLVQFRNDGFTFNRLTPYTSWNEIKPQALNLWRHYQDLARPELVVRIALRYINRLQFPLPIDDPSRFLTACPPVPDNVPGAVSSFLSRVVLEDDDRGVTTNLVQASEQTLNPQVLSVILDIDSYRAKETGFGPDEMEPTLDVLHDVKNLIFFNCVTEETLKEYE